MLIEGPRSHKQVTCRAGTQTRIQDPGSLHWAILSPVIKKSTQNLKIRQEEDRVAIKGPPSVANRAIQDCVSTVCSHSTYYCGPQALQGYKLTWRLWSKGYGFSALQDTNGLTSNLNSTLFPQCLLTTRLSNVP